MRFVPLITEFGDRPLEGGMLTWIDRGCAAQPELVPVEEFDTEPPALTLTTVPTALGLPEPFELNGDTAIIDDRPNQNRVVGHYLTPVPFGPPLLSLPSVGTTSRWAIVGSTLDASGSPLPACRVVVFDWGRLVVGESPVVADVVSSAVDGSFSIEVPGPREYQIVAYLEGSPDVAGISLHPVDATQIG